MLAGNLRQSSTTHSIKLGKYGLRTTWKLDMAVWDMWDMLLKEDRAADVMNHRNYNMTQSKLKLESSELVSLEFSVLGAGSCLPLSGTAFCEVRRFRRHQKPFTRHQWPGSFTPGSWAPDKKCSRCEDCSEPLLCNTSLLYIIIDRRKQIFIVWLILTLSPCFLLLHDLKGHPKT